MTRTLPAALPALLVLMLAQTAAAQDATATPAATAKPAATARPAATAKKPVATAKKPAATAKPAPTATHAATAPAETAQPTRTPNLAAVRQTVDRELQGIHEELEYRRGRMERKITRAELSDADRVAVEAEIRRAIQRASSEIEAIKPPADAADIETLSSAVVEDLKGASKWTERASHDLKEASSDLEDEARDALDDAADELDSLAEALDEAADRIEEKADEEIGVAESDHGTTSVNIGDSGITVEGDQGVRFGGDLHVKEGEEVDEAVAFGGNVYIDGTCKGDAVAFGGNVNVGPTGVVRGDAASFGGKVNVEEGGVIRGQKNALGPSITRGIFRHHRPELPWTARLGMKIVNILAKFLVLFALTLLAFGLLPKRMAVVQDTLETRPLVSGGFGLLAAIVAVLLSALLAITCIGAPLVIAVAVVLAGGILMGYAALTMSLGRRLPIPVGPSNAAYAAIGAGVIVLLSELIPYLGPIALVAVGCAGLGAVALTRFGQNPAPEPGEGPDEAYEKAVDEVNGV